MTSVMPDILAAIVASARRQVAVRREREPLGVVERRALANTPRGALFLDALSRPDRVNVIAECKRRSPSRGLLKADYEPASIARGYEAAGAAAVSVLTEPTFFDGCLDHLRCVRDAVGVPVLRKDFIVDEYQLFEARASGADAVLLIVAALEPAPLAALHLRARDLGLVPVVEAHTREEVAVAADCGAVVIGVNNRDLRTLTVSRTAALELVDDVPDGVVAVAESGLRSGEDLRQLRSAGYDAFLVGERLMVAERPGDALRGLMEDVWS